MFHYLDLYQGVSFIKGNKKLKFSNILFTLTSTVSNFLNIFSVPKFISKNKSRSKSHQSVYLGMYAFIYIYIYIYLSDLVHI